MYYYHIYVHYVDRKGKKVRTFLFDYTKKDVEQEFAIPYMKNKPIILGQPVPPSNIEEFEIFVSEKMFEKLILPNGLSPIDEHDAKYISECFSLKKVKNVGITTGEFITSPPKESKETPFEAQGKKNKVFIVHGRDDKPALQLQKYLRDKLKLNAEMFEDLKEESSSNTIIEQLEYIRDNIGYAFVIATPDDVGCLREEMEKLKNRMLLGKASLEAENVSKLLEVCQTRARQNVVLEHGLFIGALGRDNVCCLLHKDTQERPSDTDGILYVGFDKSVKETFPEVAEKLKKAGLVPK